MGTQLAMTTEEIVIDDRFSDVDDYCEDDTVFIQELRELDVDFLSISQAL